MTTLKQQTRVVDSLTGPVERPTLRFLAVRTPTWVSPDMLTLFGVFGAGMTFLGYFLTNLHAGFLWLASLGLAVNWFGDSLDGTLARHRKIERPRYGFFVDHTADALSQVLIMVGFGLSPFAEFGLACLALIGYLLLSIVVYIRTVLDGVFQITFGKLGPTEARIVLLLTNTGIFLFGNPTVRLSLVTTTLVDLALALVAAGLFAAFGVSVVQQIGRMKRRSD